MVTVRSPSFMARLAGAGDRAAIVAIVAELLPGMDVARRHRWLYEENPHGRALTWIARDGATGKVAGVTSFFLRRIVAGGREVTAALGGDCYVRPAFRRRGIASALHGASRRDMSRFGIEVMFGTPTPGNVTPLAQHRTRDVVEVVRYARPVGAAALGLSSRLDVVARRVLQPHSRGLVLDPFRERDPRVDAIWEQTRAELGIATVRDAEFYDWRFRRSPSQQQRPAIAGSPSFTVGGLQLISNFESAPVQLTPSQQASVAAFRRHVRERFTKGSERTAFQETEMKIGSPSELADGNLQLV